MRGSVGHWNGEIAVGFGEDMLEWLDSRGTNRYVSIGTMVIERWPPDGRYEVHHYVSVNPVARGTEGAHRVTATPGETMKHRVTVPLQDAGLKDGVLPRFEMHEVSGFHTADYLACSPRDLTPAVAPLGPIHALPWPRLRDCDGYLVPEVLGEDIYLRLLSTMRWNLPRPDAPISDGLQARMPRGLWGQSLKRARETRDCDARPVHDEAA